MLSLWFALASASEDPTMRLASPAFAPGAPIPRAHTCQGADTRPELTWSDPPPGTRSFALVVHDPDVPDPAAPKRIWVHWVVVDLPAEARGLPGATPDLPAGARHGKNDWGRAAWGGPCPPIGRHRYLFRLYALDAALPDLREPTRAELLRAIEGHALAEAELIGTYEKVRE